MHSSEELPIGTTVEILQPDYVAGAIGTVLGPEELSEGELSEGKLSNRWLIQVIGEDMVLSLTRDEFRMIR
ncbi:hypothetical protein HJG54_06930 [Leptolyngbya sp. NK1-12]|uniref:Uncharacterized protein n=1 Tax=Leptolyngbya sp. NK1-12 TaxID=2547451 RepID=A0AA96WCL5_9CYAN|nr:hypothetical protein [Leptolyngbya sp. NK1-12]WNZ22618.1 hypothetical protein HJG54_06930 [Leptolyngbya sp. NK1-12]